MYTVYVLHSSTYGKIYVGYTSNLLERFKSHNELSKKGYTKKYRPWLVVHVEMFEDKSEAMKREKGLKSGQGRKYIHEAILPRYK